MSFILEFNNPDNFKPQDLITFSETYLAEIPLLKELASKHLSNKNPLLLTTKRFDLKTGAFTTRYIYGKVVDTSDDLLKMHVQYTSIAKNSESKAEVNHEMTFRYDSYLSELPVLNDNTIPCLFNESSNNEKYAAFLDTVKVFLKQYEGNKEKKFKFVYHNTFIPGMKDYYFQGDVIKVNTSNIEVNIDFSYGVSPAGEYMNTVPRFSIRPFLTPTTMLIGII